MTGVKKNSVAAGKDFGAIRVSDLNKLYETQRAAVVDIVTGVHKIACAAFVERHRVGSHEGATTAAFENRRHYERPHHSYVVDGVRGSGKTTASHRPGRGGCRVDQHGRSRGVRDPDRCRVRTHVRGHDGRPQDQQGGSLEGVGGRAPVGVRLCFRRLDDPGPP